MKKPYEKYEVYAYGKWRPTMARSEAEAKSRVIGGQLGLAGDYEYYEIAEKAIVVNIDKKEREEKIKMDLGFDLKEWEETEAKELGGYETLELGGHEVVIKNAGLYTGQSGNKTLKIEVDIAGNDKQAGFFQKQYDENTNADKKWPSGATRYLALKGNGLSFTKGLIDTILPNANAGFKGTEELKQKGYDCLKGLKCAGVFGLEEYLDQQGVKKTATKLTQFRSLDKLNEIKIPKVKLLNGVYVDYETYTSQKTEDVIAEDFGDLVEIDENFLD